MTQLTEHFSLEELTNSQIAVRFKLDNTPSPMIIERLKQTAEALEKVRALLGVPLIINSGYRSLAVNLKVGSKPTSAHVKGWAVDFIAPKYGTPLQICHAISKATDIRFDQLIEEGTWVHLSIDPNMREMILTMQDGKYTKGLRPLGE